MQRIGEKIRSYRESIGLTRAEFGDALGEKPSKIQDVESGKQRVNDDFLLALVGRFPIDLNDLFRGGTSTVAEVAASAPDFIPIHRFDVGASAGHGALAEAEIGTGHYAFNRKWLSRRGLSPANLAVIAVRGDSMEPDLHDQDLILLDRAQRIPRDGDIYVVRYSGQLFVKRVQVIPDNRVELRSTNQGYGPITVPMPTGDDDPQPDLEFIGRVVASMHEW